MFFRTSGVSSRPESAAGLLGKGGGEERIGRAFGVGLQLTAYGMTGPVLAACAHASGPKLGTPIILGKKLRKNRRMNVLL